MSFGENVRKAREKAGITQDEFAKSLYVSAAQICRIEKGGMNPSLSLALGIAKKLGTTVEELAG